MHIKRIYDEASYYEENKTKQKMCRKIDEIDGE